MSLRNDFLFIGDGTTGGATIRTAGGGTAALPMYTFQLDPTTGMYRSGANELSFATGAIQRIKIDSGGALTLNNGGVVLSIVGAGGGVGQIRNIHRSTSDPVTGDGNHGDTWYVY